jgi:hypothetical protein
VEDHYEERQEKANPRESGNRGRFHYGDGIWAARPRDPTLYSLLLIDPRHASMPHWLSL